MPSGGKADPPQIEYPFVKISYKDSFAELLPRAQAWPIWAPRAYFVPTRKKLLSLENVHGLSLRQPAEAPPRSRPPPSCSGDSELQASHLVA